MAGIDVGWPAVVELLLTDPPGQPRVTFRCVIKCEVGGEDGRDAYIWTIGIRVRDRLMRRCRMIGTRINNTIRGDDKLMRRRTK